MGTRLHKLLWFGVSTAIIAGMIFFANVDKFISALQSAKPLPLIPAFIAGLSVLLVLGFTWHRFLTKMGIDVNYFKSLRLFLAGQFMNSITPLGQFGGEPLMAYILRRNVDTTYEEAFSTVLSADIVNGIPILTFTLGGSIFLALFGSVNDVILQTVFAGIFLTLVGGFLVYILWFKAGTVERHIIKLIRRLSDILGRGESYVESAEKSLVKAQESFETIGEDPLHLFETAVVAHLGFVLQVLCLYFIMYSVGLQTDFTPLYFVIAISSLANFTPTPGGSGAFEATMAGVLTFFLSINFEVAVVVAILFRLTTYWPGLLVGYLSLLSLENEVGR